MVDRELEFIIGHNLDGSRSIGIDRISTRCLEIFTYSKVSHF